MNLYDDKKLLPMLLHEINKPFNDDNFIFELKYDGTRTLIFVEPNKILIKNRNGSILNDTFPELKNIKNIVKNKVIFDGEIIILNDGKPSFEKLQERLLLKNLKRIKYLMMEYPAVFICFDVLYDKKDLTNLNLIDRKKYLEKYENTEFFVKSKYYFKNGIKLFNATKKLNLEGIVAKEIHSKYYFNKRSKDWIKIKIFKEGEYYIGGYKINNNEGSLASLILGTKENDKFIYVGNVSIGKNSMEFKRIKKVKQIEECFFIGFNEIGYTFIESNLKCTIMYIEKTAHKSLRQPIFKGLTL